MEDQLDDRVPKGQREGKGATNQVRQGRIEALMMAQLARGSTY
jgi:hypothetical protein